MIDSDLGIVRAAPAPMTAPKAIRRRAEPDRAAPIDPGRENGRADQKESLASEPIGQAAADEHQARKDHGVGVDDPLQDAGRGV